MKPMFEKWIAWAIARLTPRRAQTMLAIIPIQPTRLFAWSVVGLLCAGSASAKGDQIMPTSIVGSGVYYNDASLLIDGFVPPRSTAWGETTTVFWGDRDVAFTIDLGKQYAISNLLISVDNNDDYLVQSSTDGVTFTDLFLFLSSDGPVQPVPGGMDILTTNSIYPTSPADLTTPAYVGRNLTTTLARYLRISGLGGDGLYAVGEIQAFTNAVPEPGSVVMLGVGAGLLGCVVRRKAKASA
jgi:PEP-CTERM motif